MNNNKVIYSISAKDVRQVFLEKEGRQLTELEILEISDKVGDYIDWRDAIENAIIDCLYAKRQPQ